MTPRQLPSKTGRPTPAFGRIYNGTAGSLTLNADSIIDLGSSSVVLHLTDMAIGIYNHAIY